MDIDNCKGSIHYWYILQLNGSKWVHFQIRDTLNLTFDNIVAPPPGYQ